MNYLVTDRGRKLLGWWLLAIALGFLLASTGCNTMRGIGKDIEQAGEAIQKSTK